jgi:hypothetical protein
MIGFFNLMPDFNSNFLIGVNQNTKLKPFLKALRLLDIKCLTLQTD